MYLQKFEVYYNEKNGRRIKKIKMEVLWRNREREREARNGGQLIFKEIIREIIGHKLR